MCSMYENIDDGDFIRRKEYFVLIVAPDIAAAHKIILLNYGKRIDFWYLVL
jgi:hypothetical protein